MSSLWPLSKSLFMEILADRISDNFVCRLIWERLGYKPAQNCVAWLASEATPKYWKDKFPKSPPLISNRLASIHLTRSIPKEHKQSLKNCLDFPGYRINELFPRRTRRATAVNWLLSWLLFNNMELTEDGPLPKLLSVPKDPVNGHPGDIAIE